MSVSVSRNALRIRRHARVRKHIAGDASRPRLSVFRSLQHIYVQLIDDATGHTLASASTREKEIATSLTSHKSLGAAQKLGEIIAKRARDKGVTSVVFDRGGYKYHGKIKALADAARGAGLEF
jgi:large subunit ribosomal protein L18